jgi:cellulose biosynthesis protein BcsQ
VICTFYSYKGGVGRSMALANAAHILAQFGLRVLMIDFDLEAPGLEQYFNPSQHQVHSAPRLPPSNAVWPAFQDRVSLRTQLRPQQC